jgi:alpha-glucosidase
MVAFSYKQQLGPDNTARGIPVTWKTALEYPAIRHSTASSVLGSRVVMAGCFALIAFTFVTLTWGQDVTSFTSVFPSSTASVPVGTVINGTSTTFNPVFTIPASADEGANLLPNIEDPEAVNAQTACPGYKATHVQEDEHGLTAVLTLAGKPCNVYGNDIEVLNLKVEFQSANRLAINISPAHLVCNCLRKV